MCKQFEIWIADLNPQMGTETGKTGPVAILQTDLLNNFHPSTIICPITTNTKPGTNILRVHLKEGTANLYEDCDVMIDQIRAIDNKRLVNKIGELPAAIINQIKNNIRLILDL